MSNPVGVLWDGVSIAGMHWTLAGGVLFLVIVSQLLLFTSLHSIFEDQFTAEEYVSLSLAGWLLPAVLLSLLWYAGALILSPQVSLVFLGILAIAVLGLSFRNFKALAGRIAISIILLAGLFIVLRLAFVSRAVVPLYFDSAQHYRFINEILNSLASSSAGTQALTGYYHLGFHFLAALLTFFTRTEITDTMLILGQFILALMPFSVFFIVRHWTHSNSAGFFGLALSAFGWYMPAHAVDWGKYPALASLAMLPFVAGLVCLSTQSKNKLSVKKYIGLNLLLLGGALLSILLHSRTLVAYLLLAVAWLITLVWRRFSQRLRLLLVSLFLLILFAEIYYIQSAGILDPLFDAYGRDAVLVTITVLLLSIFAYRSYPGLVFFCITATSLLLASLFVPLVDLVPGYAKTTLLDRPYVQIILYLPLTFLGGFGLAGLERALTGRRISWGNMQVSLSKIAGVFFITLTIVHALFQYNLYPADCCDIVSTDDLAAIHWLDENLPAEALILTASTDLNVLPTAEYQGSAGGDGGTWITPLTGRLVAYLPFQTNFSSSQTLDQLCQLQVDYIYAGKTGWFFDDSGMSAQPENYKVVLDLPKTRVYKIIGCIQ